MTAPAISVLMAVRDGERHLPQALDSLAGQSFADFELVVVNDGSRDGTAAILAAMEARDPRLKVLRNDESMGLPRALNRGLEHVRAPIVARADADDVYRSDRLALQHAFLLEHPGIDLISCGFNRIDDDGAEHGRRVPATGHERMRFRMLFMNPVLHSGAMFRAEPVRAAGGYDPAFWTAQDSDLWARLVDRGSRLENLTEPLVDYRVHDTSIMRTRGDAGRRLSLTVPARLQAAYLGVDTTDTEAMVELYQGFRYIDREMLRRGLPGLEAIWNHARVVEDTEIVKEFASDVATSLMRQARWHARDERRFAVWLLANALKWRLRGSRGGNGKGRHR